MKVKCADCGNVVPAMIESDETKLEDHDGIWADCPDCNITGYDEIIEATEEEQFQFGVEPVGEDDPADDELKLTEIPKGGWTEEHEGQEVRLQMPMGTTITDVIIGIPIHGGGVIFGPTQELGGLLARADYAARAIAEYHAWQTGLGEDMI